MQHRPPVDRQEEDPDSPEVRALLEASDADAANLYPAERVVATERSTQSLRLQTDGKGDWRDGDNRPMSALNGCKDIDIRPTPFTNTFPIRREPLARGERRQFLMAWIFAPDLTLHAQPQAYTRSADRLYLFENLDGSDFRAELPVDEDGIVLDYPDLFRRVRIVHQ